MMNPQPEGVNVTNFQNESASGSGSNSEVPPSPGGADVDFGDNPEDGTVEDTEDNSEQSQQNHDGV